MAIRQEMLLLCFGVLEVSFCRQALSNTYTLSLFLSLVTN